ncbi:hypothetical protein GEMRC1_002929 [Eukaryota sp. GEM-RC1]
MYPLPKLNWPVCMPRFRSTVIMCEHETEVDSCLTFTVDDEWNPDTTALSVDYQCPEVQVRFFQMDFVDIAATIGADLSLERFLEFSISEKHDKTGM